MSVDMRNRNNKIIISQVSDFADFSDHGTCEENEKQAQSENINDWDIEVR